MKFKKEFIIIVLAVLFFALSNGINSSIFNNFVVKEINIKPHQLGIVQSVIEIPGLLMFLISYFSSNIPKNILGFLSFILISLGFIGYSIVNKFSSLIIFSFLWGIGIHIWFPLYPVFVINISKKDEKGKNLGIINSVSSLSSLLAMIIVFILGNTLSFREYYRIFGFLPLISALLMLSFPYNSNKEEKSKIVLKKRYKFYYLLTFLDGCRNQIFMVFALYLLVKVFGISVRYVSFLLILSSLVNIFAGYRVGKLIDRLGEGKSLIIYFAGNSVILLAFSVIKILPILSFFYILFNFLFNFNLALTTYINKISPSHELHSNLSMGMTMNHGTSVIMPIISGILWEKYGYTTIFFIGLFIGIISLLITFYMRKIKEI